MRIIFVVIISIDVCQDFEQVPAGELHITRWWSRRIRYLDSFLSLLITKLFIRFLPHFIQREVDQVCQLVSRMT